ncbi:hypothetical protein ACSFA3_20855 [Variovorax sp. RHLX14]|uniref:hypothetical protein n=1 Tax=Variovorax sp. RHLX14 TaxID=1259731 RepID=UPI003F460D75
MDYNNPNPSNINAPKDSGSSGLSTGGGAQKDVEQAANKASDAARDVKDQVSVMSDDAKNKAADVATDVKEKLSDITDDTKQAASNLVNKAKQSSEKAIDATRDYAKNAVDAAGKKVRDVHEQYQSAISTATGYVNEDPMRAVKYAAIGSAVLTAALIGIFRRR